MSEELPPLRYLGPADVAAALPALPARLDLARRTMVALVADAELPPKIAVHPRAAGSAAHAMPAFLRGADSDGSDDLLGIKWVTIFPGNVAAALPAIQALVLLSDARTGVPLAVMDGNGITAHRTAGVSGVAIERWFTPPDGRAARVAIVGAGAQARSHVPVVAHLVPGAHLVIADRDQGRADDMADEARRSGRFETVSATTDPATAADGGDLVLTMVSFGPEHQAVPAAAFASSSLIVAVDYDMCVPAVLARERRFVVDDRPQFLATRTDAVFAGYPDPDATLGQTILADARPAAGERVLVTHLGVGLADVVFADAILRTAAERGLGTILPRHA